MDWLDRAVGLERWPEAGYWNAEPMPAHLHSMIGFDDHGHPVFQDPDDPSQGMVITQGVIATSGITFDLNVKNYAALSALYGSPINSPLSNIRITGI